MDYNIIFESDNIYFIKEKLLDDYLKMINDPNINKYLFEKPTRKYKYENLKNWVEKRYQNNSYLYSLIEKSTSEYVGNVEILNVCSDSCEIGVSIISSKQNKHLGQEIILKLLDFCFNTLLVENIKLSVFDFNERAIHCYKKLGFKISDTKDNIINMKLSKKSYLYNKQYKIK